MVLTPAAPAENTNLGEIRRVRITITAGTRGIMDTIKRVPAVRKFNQPQKAAMFWEWCAWYLQTNNGRAATLIVYKHLKHANVKAKTIKNIKDFRTLKPVLNAAPKVRWRTHNWAPRAYNTTKEREKRYEAWVKEYESSGSGTRSVMRIYEVGRYSNAREISKRNMARYRDEKEHGIRHKIDIPQGSLDVLYSTYCQCCGVKSTELEALYLCPECLKKRKDL